MNAYKESNDRSVYSCISRVIYVFTIVDNEIFCSVHLFGGEISWYGRYNSSLKANYVVLLLSSDSLRLKDIIIEKL